MSGLYLNLESSRNDYDRSFCRNLRCEIGKCVATFIYGEMHNLPLQKMVGAIKHVLMSNFSDEKKQRKEVSPAELLTNYTKMYKTKDGILLNVV